MDRPLDLDTSKFQSDFGPFAETPMADAIAATVGWFRERETTR